MTYPTHDRLDDSFVACSPQTLAELEKLREAGREMKNALEFFFDALEDGWLVRNTTEDAAPGWAIKTLPKVLKLREAEAALAKAREAGL